MDEPPIDGPLVEPPFDEPPIDEPPIEPPMEVPPADGGPIDEGMPPAIGIALGSPAVIDEPLPPDAEPPEPPFSAFVRPGTS